MSIFNKKIKKNCIFICPGWMCTLLKRWVWMWMEQHTCRKEHVGCVCLCLSKLHLEAYGVILDAGVQIFPPTSIHAAWWLDSNSEILLIHLDNLQKGAFSTCLISDSLPWNRWEVREKKPWSELFSKKNKKKRTSKQGLPLTRLALDAVILDGIVALTE